MPDHTATGAGTLPVMTGTVTTGLAGHAVIAAMTADADAARGMTAAGSGSLLAVSAFTGNVRTNLLVSGDAVLPAVLTGIARSGAVAYRKPLPSITGAGVALTDQRANAQGDLPGPSGNGIAVLSRFLTAAESFAPMDGQASAFINHIVLGTGTFVPFVQNCVAVGSDAGGDDSGASHASRFDGYVLEHHR